MTYEPVPFRPAWWLPGPHWQTIGARYLRRRSGVILGRERIELPDGDFVDLDFTCAPGAEGQNPLVVVLHGLEGSARSPYILEMYRALLANGLDAVGLNFRSCSGELNRLPRLYHSGDTADFAHVLGLLQRRFGDRVGGAAGFSLGGNVLLKFLGERGPDQRVLRAAAAVSVPFDLSAGADHLRRPGGRLYATFLIRKLKRKVRAKRRIMPPSVDVPRTMRASNFREFDDATTAPLHGFRDAEDYYQQSSSAYFIDRIQTPTLIIHSEDDPFQPRDRIPVSAAEANPYVTARFTPAGGHVGFVAGPPWRPFFWGEWEAARYLAATIGSGV